jgi:hypothetical protein
VQYRKFGRTNWQVGDIGYGMWGMGAWSGSDDAESLASLERAIDLGCNFFDTAWVYGDGRSEKLLGRIIRETLPKHFTSPAESRQKIGPGPPPTTPLWTIATRPLTSWNTSTRA